MSYFDKLPAEVINHIALFLSGRDMVSFADSSQRIGEIIQGSSKALSRVACRLAFFRFMTDDDAYDALRRCDLYFNFITDSERRIKFLMDLLTKLKTGGRLLRHRRLILVLADGQLEAQNMERALRDAGHRSYLSFGYIPPRIRYQYFADISNYFIVCGWLETAMAIRTVAAFINFQQPETLDEFLDVQSFNPRRVYQVMTATAGGYEWFQKIRRFLKPHAASTPNPLEALEINGAHYEQLRLQKKKELMKRVHTSVICNKKT